MVKKNEMIMITMSNTSSHLRKKKDLYEKKKVNFIWHAWLYKEIICFFSLPHQSNAKDYYIYYS